MSTVQIQTRPETVRSASAAQLIRMPTLSSRRWTSGHSNPRLVTFGWGAVAPMASQR